jgi:hypothetical protein
MIELGTYFAEESTAKAEFIKTEIVDWVLLVTRYFARVYVLLRRLIFFSGHGCL